jgi:hypothetical protein
MLIKLPEAAPTRIRVEKGQKLTKLWPKLSHSVRHHYWPKNTSRMTLKSRLQYNRCTTSALPSA